MVTTSAWVDLEQLVRDVIIDIGYNSSDVGFDGATCSIINIIGKQSPDINRGVDRASDDEQGAGDQGLMFGFATIETEVLMPAAITYAHRLVERQAEVRKNGTLPWLRPDAKSQVTLRYRDGLIAGIHLEGPWTAAAMQGAHAPTAMRPPTPDEVESILRAADGTLHMVTLDPELEHGMEAVRRLTEAGVLAAVGHAFGQDLGRSGGARGHQNLQVRTVIQQGICLCRRIRPVSSGVQTPFCLLHQR